VSFWPSACLCLLLFNFVLGGLNSVEHGVDHVLWSFGSWFLAPCWLVLPTGFFLVLFLICSMVNMHKGIHMIKSCIDLMPKGGATLLFKFYCTHKKVRA
jgi:hypothetical protein